MSRIYVIRTYLYKYIVVACLFPMSFAPISSVQAATYYVDQKNPAASDSNPGSKVAPWSSLSPTTRVRFSPGDTVLVKEGEYVLNADADRSHAIIRPQNSGISGLPITFKSSPAFAATIVGHSQLLSPIQIINQSHITIEGFKIINPGKHGLLIKGSKDKPVEGVVLRNNHIVHESNAQSIAFTNGIDIEYSKKNRVVNNRIANATIQNRTEESTAIRLTNVVDQKIEHNNIENLSYGISLRNNANNTKIRKNLIVNTLQPIQVTGRKNSDIRKLKIANNIFTSSEVVISLLPDGGVIRKVFINNNVINDYSVAAMQVIQPGMGKIEVWNNIFNRGETGPIFIADVFTYDDPPLSIARMDYNVFTQQPLFITGLYNSNRRLAGMDAWQGYTEQDAHSIVSAIEFKDQAKNNYRLARKYKNIIKGRVDGKASSRRSKVGAYTRDTKYIGMKSTPLKTQPPKLAIRSDHPDKRSTNSSSNKQNKPKKNTSRRAEQVAMAKPKKDKPNSTVTRRGLKWDVDRRVQFSGKCVLESNKIDFYDGHDNTGLKFRMLDNELYLITRSNIDISFKDVGLQVGKNDFLHADSVVRDQNVVISKELPRFLTQLRKSSKARVQLRFWPSYPATKSYSEVVALEGFLPAYKSYMDCQRGNNQ